MKSSPHIQQQQFHGVHREQLLLSCDETGCLAEISLSGARQVRLTVEVFIQPRDQNGLPLGPTIEVCKHDVDLFPVSNQGRLVGRFWLPESIQPSTAMNCYFRLTHRRLIEDHELQ